MTLWLCCSLPWIIVSSLHIAIAPLRKLEQAFTVDCFDDIDLFVPLLAPAAS